MRGGIRAVPRGEIEAARAAGMSTFATYRLVILPRAFSIILPAYSNEVIILLKGTSLASTITLLELMGQSQLAASTTYQPIQVFAIAGVIYYLLTLTITWIFRTSRAAVQPLHGRRALTTRPLPAAHRAKRNRAGARFLQVGRPARRQPWRALKRRWVLLIT